MDGTFLFYYNHSQNLTEKFSQPVKKERTISLWRWTPDSRIQSNV